MGEGETREEKKIEEMEILGAEKNGHVYNFKRRECTMYVVLHSHALDREKVVESTT